MNLDRRSMMLAGCAGAFALSAGPTRAAPSPEVVVGKDGWLFPAFDQVSRVDFTRVKQGAALINDAVGLMQQGGIKVAICLTPAKSRVYSEFLPDGVKYTPDTQRRYAVELEELRRPGTIVPDLATKIVAEHKAKPDELLFFKGDTHWTPLGAACAVDAVADDIKKANVLPASTGESFRLGTPREAMQSRNDLAALLGPDEKSKYPLQAYKLPQLASDASGGGLLSEDGADVALVGNSYLHPSFGFSTMLSSKLNRPMWLVWKTHAFSPFWNLLDYMGSDAFKTHKPKLIVWIFHETDLTIPPNNSAIWGQTAMKPEDILAGIRRDVMA